MVPKTRKLRPRKRPLTAKERQLRKEAAMVVELIVEEALHVFADVYDGDDINRALARAETRLERFAAKAKAAPKRTAAQCPCLCALETDNENGGTLNDKG